MYKVKWEPTWEPAENLASCQHLIDEFWSFVNKAKTNEEVAQQHRKRVSLVLLMVFFTHHEFMHPILYSREYFLHSITQTPHNWLLYRRKLQSLPKLLAHT